MKLRYVALAATALAFAQPASTAPAFPVTGTITLCFPYGAPPCPGYAIDYALVAQSDGTGTLGGDPITWTWTAGVVDIDYVELDDRLRGTHLGGGCASGTWFGSTGNFAWEGCKD